MKRTSILRLTVFSLLAASLFQLYSCDNGTTDIAASTYTITFNANGGSGTMESVTAVESTNITLPVNTFTRTAYSFSGWTTSATGSVEYTDEESYTMGTSDATLYAVWNWQRDTLVNSAVIEWNFDNSIEDTRGNNDLSLSNGEIAYSTIKQKEGTACAAFNGSTSLVSDSECSFTDNKFTMSYWLYQDTSESGYEEEPDICTWGDYDAYAFPSVDLFSCTVTDGTNENSFYTSSGSYTADQWVQLVVRWDGAAFCVFINGVKYPSTNSDIPDISSLSNVFYIGGNVADDDDYYLTGYLDDVIIWNKSLTDIEVSLLYNSY